MTTERGHGMLVDYQRLSDLRRFEDRSAGFEEEFLRPRLGGARAVATLTRPLGERQHIGWVMCHSFGIEQIHLGRLEVTIARDLAAAGFPVLRYNGRGYGDSEGSAMDITLGSHLADGTDAVAVMQELGEVEEVGLLGVRFGGTVAAIVAERTGARFFAAWEPILDGRRYMDQHFRSGALAAIVGKGSTHRPVTELKEELATRGWADLGGLALTQQCYDEIRELRLIDELGGFDRQSLLIAVNPKGAASPDLVELANRLRDQGGTCHLTALKHQTVFGRFRYGDGEGDVVKVDTLHELTTQISAETLAWCRSVVPA